MNREESSKDIKFSFVDEEYRGPLIKVIGVGGGGGNAVNNLIEEGIEGVELIGINTDSQDLSECKAPIKYQIGKKITRGLGAGSDPEIGRKAAEEDTDRLTELIAGADLVFVTACLGGGTGSGAAPYIANLSTQMEILTISIVIKPLETEGIEKAKIAEKALRELKESSDILIPISNQNLVDVCNEKENLTVEEAFKLADDVLMQAVNGISEIMRKKGRINLDFADLKTIVKKRGIGLISKGFGSGERRVELAVESALKNPMLEDITINGAKSLLLNIKGGKNLSFQEMNYAAKLIRDYADPNAFFIFGLMIDEKLEDEVVILVIAAGFDPVMEERILVQSLNFERTQHPFFIHPSVVSSTPNYLTTPSDLANMNTPSYRRKPK
ncbi:MAG: cell division protein FtsZ [Acidobacteriota bacterium]